MTKSATDTLSVAPQTLDPEYVRRWTGRRVKYPSACSVSLLRNLKDSSMPYSLVLHVSSSSDALSLLSSSIMAANFNAFSDSLIRLYLSTSSSKICLSTSASVRFRSRSSVILLFSSSIAFVFLLSLSLSSSIARIFFLSFFI